MTAISSCHENYVHYVMFITSISQGIGQHPASKLKALIAGIRQQLVYYQVTASHYSLDGLTVMYIIRLTHMKRPETSKPPRGVDAKADLLRRQGTLHPHPDAVRDEAFRQDEFFDPLDLVQVRYEMLRRHQVGGDAVTEVAHAFGVSRQAYYVTEAAFEEKGIAGLLPRRRGPRRGHKCTDEILDFVEQWRTDVSTEKEVSEAVRKRFGVSIHPRSLVRALTRRKKKRR